MEYLGRMIEGWGVLWMAYVLLHMFSKSLKVELMADTRRQAFLKGMALGLVLLVLGWGLAEAFAPQKPGKAAAPQASEEPLAEERALLAQTRVEELRGRPELQERVLDAYMAVRGVDGGEREDMLLCLSRQVRIRQKGSRAADALGICELAGTRAPRN